LRGGAPAGVRAVAVEARDGGFAVRLDGKPLRTPAGRDAIAPTAALAEAVAAEWRGQGAKPDAARLPLTRLLATALDRVPGARAALEAELLGYAGTELVCHRAASPPELVRRQAETWQPLLDWLALRFDAPLAVTDAIVAVAQPAASLAALARALAALDPFRLAGLSLAVGAAGSLAVGLALAEGRLDAAAAFAAAELDAGFQIERWGEDEEARARRDGLRAELALAARWFALLAPPAK
jgi:chaperone required for assembly of F1-ATPase